MGTDILNPPRRLRSKPLLPFLQPISINVNPLDFWAHASNADIYRLSFIRLKP